MRVRGVVLSLLSLGVVLGFASGAAGAFYRLAGQGYLRSGLRYLLVETILEPLNRGVLFGLVLGPVLLYYVLRLWRWAGRRLFQVILLDRDRVLGILLGALLALAFLVAGGYVVNLRLIVHHFTRASLLLNLGLVVASVLVFLLSQQILGMLSYSPLFVGRLRSMLHVVGGVLVLSTLLLNLGSLLFRPRLPAGTPNVLLLTVDTLRADHLGCYQYSRASSPNLDRWARRGKLFLNCYSHAPVTSSSFSSIMTGFPAKETGTYSNARLRPAMTTLAEYLRNAGFRTGAIVSNYVLRRGRGFESGFETFDDEMDVVEANRAVPERIAEGTTARALAWLDDNGDEPFFFWVHYQDPHGPYTPPLDYRDLFATDEAESVKIRINDDVHGRGGIPSYQRLGAHREYGYYVAQYDAEIRYFDQSVSALLEELERSGLLENTLILFTSDHGEGMGEHDYYFAHGDFLYKGLLHVPLVLWAPPDVTSSGQPEPALVQHVDIVPTILDFVGIEPLAALPGRSLLDDGLADATVFSETVAGDNYKCSLISEGIQVLYDAFNDHYQIFDLRTDSVLQDTTVLGSRAVKESMADLASLCAAGVATSGLREGIRSFAADEKEKLRSLGYVQ